MSKKSRKQRKKERSQGGATVTPVQARPARRPATAIATAELAAPASAAAAPPEVRPEELVAEIVDQVFHAIEDALPGPAVSGDNRRKHPRIALTVEIDLSSESHFFSGLSGDVSEGGVFVETYRDIPVGSEVALEFALPSGIIHAHGAVKWHRDRSDSSPPGVGVEFAELSDDGKALIVAFCARRAPLFYEVAS